MIAIGQIRKHFWMSLYLPMTIRDFPSHNRVSGVIKESSLLPHFVPKMLILNFLRISN